MSVQPTPSQSSMATSTTHTSVFSLNSRISSLAPSSREDRRAALSLIDSTRVRFSKDFRALVRSSSSAAPRRGPQRRQPSRPAQSPERGARARIVAFSAYAPIGADEPTEELRMSRDESRSGRGFGARLVGLLNRSRSRSKSKKRRSHSLEQVPVSEMPVPLSGGSLGRANVYLGLTAEQNVSSSSSSGSGAKPITRSPSRPLSGATTVTDTTAKPYQRRSPQGLAPVKPNDISGEHHVHLRTEVLTADPSSSSQKSKKANFFSVAISHPRKQSSDSGKSRPPSRTNTATPPTPSERPHRGLWSPFRSGSRSGSQSSMGGQSSRSNVGDHDPSRHTPPPVPKLSQETTSRPSRVFPPSPEEQHVHILNSPPPPYRRDEYIQEVDEPMQDALDLDGRCSPLCGLPSPKLPPAAGPSAKGKEKERARGARDRIGEKEPKRLERTVSRSRRAATPLIRETERERRAVLTPIPIEKIASGSGLSRRGSTKESIASALRTKRTKHGSFDFERPVSTNTGGAVNMRMALNGMGVGADYYGLSSAPPMERSMSAKEANMRSESLSRLQAQKQTSSLPSSTGRPATRPKLDVYAPPMNRLPTESSRETSSPAPGHHPIGHSRDGDLTTPSTSHSGHSSSLGRNAGGRMMRTMHGAFKFEPAVPPIPGSPAGEERGGRRLAAQLTPAKVRQERATAKGRSLDLGLSLSWAPQKVREEAVLSYNRPSSRTGGSIAKPTPRWGNDDAVDEQGHLGAGSSRAASDVARAFREALGDAAYATFKTYVHRFDAQAIPLDGPYGLISHAKRLLDNAATLNERRKQDLLDRFVRLVRENQ